MIKSAMIRAGIKPELKENVESILNELGISTTEVITLFYNQIRLNNGIPFEIKIPNATTENTFKDTDSGKNIVKAKDADDMFAQSGI